MNVSRAATNEQQRNEAVGEIQALRRELAAFRRQFDEFAGAFLNAKFPYGKPVDRWPRRG